MRPRIVKQGRSWRVYHGPHLWGAYGTHARAIHEAHRLATHNRRKAFQSELARVTHALNRWDNNRK